MRWILSSLPMAQMPTPGNEAAFFFSLLGVLPTDINLSLQKPAPLVGGAQAPVPAPTADVDMTDATPSQPQQRMKRPLPPPPPLSALPPVTAEPLLMASAWSPMALTVTKM